MVVYVHFKVRHCCTLYQLDTSIRCLPHVEPMTHPCDTVQNILPLLLSRHEAECSMLPEPDLTADDVYQSSLLMTRLDAIATLIENMRHETKTQMDKIRERLERLEQQQVSERANTVFQFLLLMQNCPKTDTPEDWVRWLQRNKYIAIIAEKHGLREVFVRHLQCVIKLFVDFNEHTITEPKDVPAPEFLQLMIKAVKDPKPLYRYLETQIMLIPLHDRRLGTHEGRMWFKDFSKAFLQSIPYLNEHDTLTLLSELYRTVIDLDAEFYFAVIRLLVTISIVQERCPSRVTATNVSDRLFQD